ncbi:glycosyltransferase WbuB [Bacillus salacetis]|uniref:Glycosyltransferase WbuB n=1 Tax=Bacillus salacetis TaxID=2315464 RepID=A0A3A1QUP5_9BACI|nr:glycosyltransferase family 4 protein [Bacillus salacetis]RIW31877.1 glycosyltransferase WbuB [Bacillus salacetis]
MTVRILIITQNFYPVIGSAGNRMKNIYTLLAEEGYEVEVLTTEPSYPNKNLYKSAEFWDHEPLNNNSLIYRVGVSDKKNKLGTNMIKRLYYYLEITVKMLLFIFKYRKKADIILVSSPPIFMGVVGLLAKRILKAKMYLEVRDLWPDSLKGVGKFNHQGIIRLLTMFEKFLYNAADKIIVNSRGFVNHITELSRKTKEDIIFIPNGATKEELEIAKKSTKEFSVIYAGNLGLAQDIEIIKQLATKLFKEGITFTVIGYGYKTKDFTTFVENEKLTNVNIINPTTRRNCIEIISEHKVGIVTLTDKEVFETVLPGKLIDYMTCEVPVVGIVSGTSEKLITDNQIGLVSKSRTAEDVFSKILYLRENKAEIGKMKENCRKVVQNNYLWEDNIKKLIKIVEKQGGNKVEY